MRIFGSFLLLLLCLLLSRAYSAQTPDLQIRIDSVLEEVGTTLYADSLTDSVSVNYVTIPLSEQQADTDDVYFFVEEMPRFQDGSADEFRMFLAQNMKFPDSAMEYGICGTLYFSFVIDEQGNLGEIEILRRCNPAVDAEIIRVLESSPPWTPGMQRGKPVKVKFTFPLRIHWQ
ncbi:MAG: energy transducer TonB [Bacteroidales bacterium]|nr:energy transducer TonB [Bacteroidales bacterium]